MGGGDCPPWGGAGTRWSLGLRAVPGGLHWGDWTQSVFLVFFLIYLCIYLLLAVLGLHCYTWAFSGCSEPGLLFVVVRGLLIAVTCLCCGTRARGTWASVVVARRLSSCGSWALESRLSSYGVRA